MRTGWSDLILNFMRNVKLPLDELITAGKVVKFLRVKGEDGKNYYRSGEGEYVG